MFQSLQFHLNLFFFYKIHNLTAALKPLGRLLVLLHISQLYVWEEFARFYEMFSTSTWDATSQSAEGRTLEVGVPQCFISHSIPLYFRCEDNRCAHKRTSSSLLSATNSLNCLSFFAALTCAQALLSHIFTLSYGTQTTDHKSHLLQKKNLRLLKRPKIK